MKILTTITMQIYNPPYRWEIRAPAGWTTLHSQAALHFIRTILTNPAEQPEKIFNEAALQSTLLPR